MSAVELNEEQLGAITKTVLECLEQKEKQRQKQKRDNRLRNIKLLLRNYRTLAIHCDEAALDIEEIDSKLALDELDTDVIALESVKRSKKRTLAMVRFLNHKLDVYSVLCEKTKRADEARRHQTIYLLYISDMKYTVEQIAECQKLNPRTVYRDIDKAIEDLASLVFGVDSIRFAD